MTEIREYKLWEAKQEKERFRAIRERAKKATMVKKEKRELRRK